MALFVLVIGVVVAVLLRAAVFVFGWPIVVTVLFPGAVDAGYISAQLDFGTAVIATVMLTFAHPWATTNRSKA